MTGRVCPVHGEWSATGVCRWCEPSDTVQMEYIQPFAHPPAAMPVKRMTADELAAWYDWSRVDAVELLDGLPPIAVCPDNIQAAMNELWLRLSTRGGATAFFPHTLVLADESRLAAQHAALRWERVARRWNYKHRRPGGLDCGGREWVWMHWLDQMGRRYACLTWTPRQPP